MFADHVRLLSILPTNNNSIGPAMFQRWLK